MFFSSPPTEDPRRIHEALRKGEIVLVDVREPGEHREEHIEGAVLHPLSTFDPARLPAQAGKAIVLHCVSGKRSATALAQCAKAGVPVRAHMGGGIMAWKAAGLPTVK